MGKTLLFGTVAAAGLSLGILSAQAADIEPVAEPATWYVSLFGGVSFLEDVDAFYNGDEGDYSVETDPGYIVGGAVGMRIWDPVRLEVEVSYAEWDADRVTATDLPGSLTDSMRGDLNALFLLGNIWFDIDTGTVFRPYLGGGAGVGWADAHASFDDPPIGYGDGEMGFAFQLGGGVQVDLAEHVALDIGYRFKAILDVDLDDVDGSGVYESADFYSHNIQGGIIFSF